MPKYKPYVGPDDKYDLIASMQFNLLTFMGLRDYHKLLDIGCGSLRVGRLLIPYLLKGNYFGLEPEKWLVNEALANELGRDILGTKKPSFLHNRNFDIKKFNQVFDFIIAQSIFSHTSLKQVSDCFKKVKKHLSPRGYFLATFYFGDKDYSGADWVYPTCIEFKSKTIKNIAHKNNLSFQIIDWPHPNGQTWVILSHKNGHQRIKDPTYKDMSKFYVEELAIKRYINDSTDTGSWDAVRRVGNVFLANGWARDPKLKLPAKKIFIIDENQNIIASGNVKTPRKDVSEFFKTKQMLACGWESNFNRNLLPKGTHQLRAYLYRSTSQTALLLKGKHTIKVK